MTIDDTNRLVMQRLSIFLNEYSRFITADMVREITAEFGMSMEDSYRLLLEGALEFSENREICERYINKCVHMLDPEIYRQDPYYRNVRFPRKKGNGWELKTEEYEAFEAFVCDDLRGDEAGRMLPQIGFFPERYSYPCVLQGGREWMTITPNEVETMREPIAAASGHVMTMGLGLGYYAYMAARKEETIDVTVVERDPEVIRLFETYIRPQLECGEKIRILQADAMEIATRLHDGVCPAPGIPVPDYVFADLWHDPSDGVPLYRQLKPLENASIRYDYWIEKTMKFYL